MLKIPTLTELMEAGVHFGHQKSKSHPKMKPFIYSIVNGVQIIDLEKTAEKLKEALEFIREKVSQGGIVLFLGTKVQVRKIIKENAEKVEMPYIIERWLGGTITNFSEISKLINKLNGLNKKKTSGELKKYTKKEQLGFSKEIERLERIVGGLKDLKKLPDIIFIADIKKETSAIKEASKRKIPLVAIVDANGNPEKVDYPIPANDDGIKSLKLIIGLIAEAIKEGLKKKESKSQIQTEGEKKKEEKSEKSKKDKK